ncbi:MAG: WSD1 family O-acyltransferase, partial [Chloroflexi bacterium]|nr:WSD1 family O-acyltransferase [Chloroflexota bacterium]
VKAISKVTGGTVNDVLLTAAAGALGRYLRHHGQPIGGLDFRAAVPVNLRPMDEEPTLGNNFGLVFLALPVGVDDPLERLQELKRRMDAIKGSVEAVVAFGILAAVGLATAEIQDLVVQLFGAKATTVMTNVPGPRETRYFAGKAMRQVMFWVPQSGRLGLGVSILSYAGEVLLGVATDAGLVPDPEMIIQSFQEEFEALLALAAPAEAPATKVQATA